MAGDAVERSTMRLIVVGRGRCRRRARRRAPRAPRRDRLSERPHQAVARAGERAGRGPGWSRRTAEPVHEERAGDCLEEIFPGRISIVWESIAVRQFIERDESKVPVFLEQRQK